MLFELFFLQQTSSNTLHYIHIEQLDKVQLYFICIL